MGFRLICLQTASIWSQISLVLPSGPQCQLSELTLAPINHHISLSTSLISITPETVLIVHLELHLELCVLVLSKVLSI